MTSIAEYILEKLQTDHRGRQWAITRQALLAWVHDTGVDTQMTDRELRRVYSTLPICSCNEGLFWPITSRELKDFESYMDKKIYPHFSRRKMVMDYHRGILEQRQMELF